MVTITFLFLWNRSPALPSCKELRSKNYCTTISCRLRLPQASSVNFTCGCAGGAGGGLFATLAILVLSFIFYCVPHSHLLSYCLLLLRCTLLICLYSRSLLYISYTAIVTSWVRLRLALRVEKNILNHQPVKPFIYGYSLKRAMKKINRSWRKHPFLEWVICRYDRGKHRRRGAKMSVKPVLCTTFTCEACCRSKDRLWWPNLGNQRAIINTNIRVSEYEKKTTQRYVWEGSSPVPN